MTLLYPYLSLIKLSHTYQKCNHKLYPMDISKHIRKLQKIGNSKRSRARASDTQLWSANVTSKQGVLS